MSKGPWTEHRKREEILDVSLRLFLEHGYEGTSMKMIAEESKCAVGLTYNYFATKDQLFDEAIARFVESYRPLMEEKMDQIRANPRMGFDILYTFMKECAYEFRKKYKDHLRWTTTLTISSHVLNATLPYFKQVLEILVEHGMPAPLVSIDTLAIILNHGIGTLVTQSTDEEYEAMERDMRVAVYLLLGQPAGAPEAVMRAVENNKSIVWGKIDV